MTTTIRVSIHTRDILQELARRSGASIQSVIENAVEQYRRRQILEATNAAYAALQTDPEARADLGRERTDWDQTLADGLGEV